jgi:hypothetical protein
VPFTARRHLPRNEESLGSFRGSFQVATNCFWGYNSSLTNTSLNMSVPLHPNSRIKFICSSLLSDHPDKQCGHRIRPYHGLKQDQRLRRRFVVCRWCVIGIRQFEIRSIAQLCTHRSIICIATSVAWWIVRNDFKILAEYCMYDTRMLDMPLWCIVHEANLYIV